MQEELDGRLLAALRRYITDPDEWRAVLEGGPLLETSSLDSLSVVNLVTELELLFDARFTPDALDSALQDVHALNGFLKGVGGRL